LERENAVLRDENVALRKRVGELEAKLGLPPKTPDNSSTPPSAGHKVSEEENRKAKGKPHAGAHRPLATLRTYASVLEAELDKILRIKPKCETAKKILWA